MLIDLSNKQLFTELFYLKNIKSQTSIYFELGCDQNVEVFPTITKMSNAHDICRINLYNFFFIKLTCGL